MPYLSSTAENKKANIIDQIFFKYYKFRKLFLCVTKLHTQTKSLFLCVNLLSASEYTYSWTHLDNF